MSDTGHLPIRVFIGGFREPVDPEFFNKIVNGLLDKISNGVAIDKIEIVYCDEHSFVDKLTYRFARQHGCKITPISARWNIEGSDAAYNRNRQVFAIVDYAILFWDGFSKDVRYMVEHIRKNKVKTKLIILDTVS